MIYDGGGGGDDDDGGEGGDDYDYDYDYDDDNDDDEKHTLRLHARTRIAVRMCGLTIVAVAKRSQNNKTTIFDSNLDFPIVHMFLVFLMSFLVFALIFLRTFKKIQALVKLYLLLILNKFECIPGNVQDVFLEASLILPDKETYLGKLQHPLPLWSSGRPMT